VDYFEISRLRALADTDRRRVQAVGFSTAIFGSYFDDLARPLSASDHRAYRRGLVAGSMFGMLLSPIALAISLISRELWETLTLFGSLALSYLIIGIQDSEERKETAHGIGGMGGFILLPGMVVSPYFVMCGAGLVTGGALTFMWTRMRSRFRRTRSA